jgi:hypothetical protein
MSSGRSSRGPQTCCACRNRRCPKARPCTGQRNKNHSSFRRLCRRIERTTAQPALTTFASAEPICLLAAAIRTAIGCQRLGCSFFPLRAGVTSVSPFFRLKRELAVTASSRPRYKCRHGSFLAARFSFRPGSLRMSACSGLEAERTVLQSGTGRLVEAEEPPRSPNQPCHHTLLASRLCEQSNAALTKKM